MRSVVGTCRPLFLWARTFSSFRATRATLTCGPRMELSVAAVPLEEEEKMLAAQPAREKAFANGKPNVFYVANNSATSPTTPRRLMGYRRISSAISWWITARRSSLAQYG